ncbi:MAG: hypothetical protein HY928_13890 [Elusimicrobia bacterium]|nr:hypothetical protein [Elusimicrobiota bacterium]
MAKILDTVLLLALPASGKSEVRRYLKLLPPDSARDDFHMGPTVQLDDFPYVHMMRRVDDELAALGKPRVFFHSGERPFQDTRDWGTLVKLVGEDHADLVAKRTEKPASATALLIDRIEKAAAAVGIAPRLKGLDAGARKVLESALEKEAAEMLAEKHSNYPDSLAGKTLVIEFARGGPDKSKMPLPSPLGYRYSLAQLPASILEKAVILYVWVTPEESRRKNTARTDPNDPGSILHHGVPLEVMLNDYGCDDMDWLEKDSKTPGTVSVSAHGKTFVLPVARFDNRVDKTSFLREEKALWKPSDVKAVHEGLKSALDSLAARDERKLQTV